MCDWPTALGPPPKAWAQMMRDGCVRSATTSCPLVGHLLQELVKLSIDKQKSLDMSLCIEQLRTSRDRYEWLYLAATGPQERAYPEEQFVEADK